MSQYPSPYQPPDPRLVGPGAYAAMYDPYGVLLAPARRSGIMMIVLGSLGALCGSCYLLGMLIPTDVLMKQAGAQSQALQAIQDQGVSLRAYLAVLGGFMLGGAITMLILGIFVRRGGIGAVVTSMVFVGLLLFLFLGFSVVLLVNIGAPQGAVGLVMNLVLTGAMGVLMTWLVQAAKASRQLRYAQAQYQAQFHQYQQQQQAYMMPGAYAPPPPPPAEPPPAGTPPPAAPPPPV